MRTITIEQARTELPQALDEVEAGAEVIIGVAVRSNQFAEHQRYWFATFTRLCNVPAVTMFVPCSERL